MAKYVNENVAQAIANDIQKNRVLLGAFDIVDTSNANYNLISRNTGFVDLGSLNWVYLTTSGHERWRASFVGFKFINNATPINAVSNNYKIDSSDNIYGHEELNTIGNEDYNFLCCYNGSSTEKPTGILQFELANNLKYTEKVIKGVPILNLDQNGANWLRSEWEKGLNLYSGSQSVGGTNLVNDVITLDTPITLKAGKTYIMNATTNALHPFLVFYNSSNVDVAEFFLNNAITPTSDIEAKKIAFYYDGNGGTAGTFTYSNIMLNEGDHAYPYQPYSGAIVHEKDIENVAKTNVENEFSIRQKIIDDRSDLPLTLKSDTSSTNFIQFKNKQDVGIGFIGIQDYRPYFYTSNSSVKPSGELLTNNDIAELKSLVYDNQYPAVKNIKFNTFTALPNSIDGDSLIFGAGSDMTKIDGMSVGYNQLFSNYNFASDTGYTISDVGYISITVANNKMTFTLTQNIQSGANISVRYETKANHKYLILTKFKSLVGNNTIRISNASISSYFDTTVAEGNTVSVASSITESSSSNAYMILKLVGPASTNQSFEVYYWYAIDLTQWFGSNDNIPSDLLSNPSLFTSKYWKGSLDYDTGHIESAKPKAVVSYGANLLPNSVNITSQGQTITSPVKLKAGTTYTFKFHGGTNSGAYDLWGIKDGTQTEVFGSTSGVASAKTFTPTSDCDALGLYPNNISNTNIMLNLGSTALPYTDYIAPKRYLINVGTNNSVNGVNTIKDIMGVLDTNRKIGKVDLGSLSWQKSGTEFYAQISGIKNYSQYLCSNGMSFSQDTNQYIYYQASGTSYETMDTTQFKTAMSGVYLYYELATTYTEQNPQDANFPTNIEIQKGGSLEIESDLPCDITLEVAVSKVY